MCGFSGLSNVPSADCRALQHSVCLLCPQAMRLMHPRCVTGLPLGKQAAAHDMLCALQTTYQTAHGQLLDLITAPIGTVRFFLQLPLKLLLPCDWTFTQSLQSPTRPSAAGGPLKVHPRQLHAHCDLQDSLLFLLPASCMWPSHHRRPGRQDL